MDAFSLKPVVIDLNLLWDYIVKLPVVIVILLVGWGSMKYVRGGILHLFGQDKGNQGFVQLTVATIKVIVWTVVLAAIFSVLGFNEISLLFSGSIAILALGVTQGLHGIVSDWVSGIFLASDGDFKPGRKIKFGTIEGTVVSLGLRKTKIQDSRGDLHIVPNRHIDNSTYLIRRPRVK